MVLYYQATGQGVVSAANRGILNMGVEKKAYAFGPAPGSNIVVSRDAG